jgi:hypothetical protein
MAYEMWLVTMYNKSLLNICDNGESMAYFHSYNQGYFLVIFILMI